MQIRLPRGLELRRARPGDAAGVGALVEQLGYASDGRGFTETFTQVVRHPEAAVFVIAEGVRVVGYVAVSHRPQIHLGGRLATIDELAVDADHRGQGLGSFLLDQALELARGLGCVRIEVSTRRSRDSYARGFYVRHGFVEADSALLRQP
ncbi:MAG: GNAT family N-acetyltransferase [Kofleriaceae bacterium]|nr:GNAT family N-acetyltransferase [Kofleriaceae bacterium]MCB9570831.1 GNAT family N-acetyltransferase [Kofleriaceae bacterium]